MSKHRTQGEIAQAHAEAMDALYNALLTHSDPSPTAQRLLQSVGAEHYFTQFVPLDMTLLRKTLHERGIHE